MIQAMRQRQPIPEAIANAPELWIGLELFYVAFWDLHSSRHAGFGIGPIPWQAIHEYCMAQGIDFDSETYEDMHHLLGKMDEAYLKHVTEKNK